MAKERPPIEEMTLRQLRKVAAEYEISRYSRMRKSQLLKAIQSAKLGDLVGQHEQKTEEERQTVEAKKFELGQPTGVAVAEATELAMVDWNLGDLPDGYDEARIVLLPRDPQWAYAYWDIPDRDKEACRRQGGQQLALRIYDATDLNLDYQMPHTVQEYACDEMAREWYLPIPLSDRSYVVEIGYRCNDGRWLMLARSSAIHVPPVYPTDWSEDYFLSIPWEQNLIGRTFFTLMPKQRSVAVKEVHDEAITEQRQPGSIYGSMQLAESAISSFASGAGMSAVAGSAQMTASGAGMLTVAGSAQMTASGAGMLAVSGSAQMTASGAGMLTVPGSMQMSGVGLETSLRVPGSIQFTASGMGFLTTSGMGMLTTSGMGMLTASGMGMLTASGMGLFSASVPQRPRQFWLVADAELIVYGATEPDATVTIGGQRIDLQPDGTFRHHMSFQDGVIDYPILAVAADGVQTRSIHMRFERETLERRTNTKEEAIPEWIR